MSKAFELCKKLAQNKSLSHSEYEVMLDTFTDDDAQFLANKAEQERKKIYGNKIFIRGLVEISNYCKNDCYYCGIRKSNKCAQRYRLSREQILDCCATGYALGFRTFVLQGGEDGYFSVEFLTELIFEIKEKYPDAALTLSLGEMKKEEYKSLYDAGADRYLLRHETADSGHYSLLHPKKLSLENRIRCLYDLKDIGFQVGCGFMVGSPYQTNSHIAKDLKFIEEFSPDMCGIGPFIPHKDTPFSEFTSGTLEKTLFLLSVVRIIKPNILLPATTALATLDKNGRKRGILAGANVVMPNLSPQSVREKYMLYDNKLSLGMESAQNLEKLKEEMASIGYEVVCDRGDVAK